MAEPPFHALLGAVLTRTDEGASARLTLAPHHLNSRGVVHGGVYSALLDAAMGSAVVASIPKEWWCATTSLSVQFLDGASEGVIEAVGHVVRRGRSVAFVSGDLCDGSGRTLAVAHGTWHLWPYRPGGAGLASAEAFVTFRGGERLPVGKIVAVGRNYADHAQEMGNAPSAPPVLFLKPATAIVHDGGSVVLPAEAGAVHHEVELVAVIGKPGKNLRAEEALDHVVGYAVGLDMTLRDLQAEAKAKGEPWDVAKGFDTSAPISTVTPREEVGDGSGLAIVLEVNGTSRQLASTSEMLLGVAEILAHVSKWMRLERGDLIFTGTPAGVGPVVAGDMLEARIERVGTLRVSVVAEPA